MSIIGSSRWGARAVIRASILGAACCTWALPGTALARAHGAQAQPSATTVTSTASNDSQSSGASAGGAAEGVGDGLGEGTGAGESAGVGSGEGSGKGETAASSTGSGCGAQTCDQAQSLSVRESVVGWGRNATGGLGAGYRGASRGAVSTQLKDVRAVATAGSSYALMENGTVDAWGDNTFGQLGNGTHSMTSVPAPVHGVTNAIAIAAGAEHAMALLSNGTVMTWGGNSYGQLGIGTPGEGREVGEANPVLVPGLSGVVAIAAGGADDAALLENGTVEAWGENKSGQLGDGTTAEKDVPTPVKGLTHVKSIAIGGDSSIGGHLLAVLQNGTVMAVGGNTSGQLGDGSTTASSSPVPVKGLSGVAEVAGDISHSIALLENGTAMTWGSNGDGQLGVPTREQCNGSPCSRVAVAVGLSDVTAISAGYRFSLAISNGKAFAWGWNQHHELGQPGTSTSDQSRPVQVPGISELSAISAGGFHSLALANSAGPPTKLEVSPGVGTLTVNWLADEEPLSWTVEWRPAGVHNKWSKLVYLPTQARSYTVTGLSVQRYEVMVRNRNFGSAIIIATPLAEP